MCWVESGEFGEAVLDGFFADGGVCAFLEFAIGSGLSEAFDAGGAAVVN